MDNNIFKFEQEFKKVLHDKYEVTVSEDMSFVLETVVCIFKVTEEERAFKVDFTFISELTNRRLPYLLRFDKRCINVEPLMTPQVEHLIEKILAFKAANRKNKSV